MYLLSSGLRPHGLSWFSGDVNGASLDHALWFHAPVRADQWLLYAIDSPASAGSRGYNRGTLFTAEGRMVATTMQEGLMRLRQPDS